MPQEAEYTEDSGNFFGTHIRLMQSSQMYSRALARLKSSDSGFKFPKDEKGNSILAAIRASQIKGAGVFHIESTSRDPKFAQLFLNALMNEFLAYKEEVRAATAADLLTSVSDQLYKQERDLKTEQERLKRFQSENNIVLLDEEVKTGGSQLAQLNSQLAMLELELNLLDAVALERSLNAGGLTNSVVTAPDPRLLGISTTAPTMAGEIASAKQRIEGLRLQRDQLGRFLRPSHPKIVALNQNIAQAGKLIEFLKTQDQEQMTIQKQAVAIRIKSLKGAIAEMEANVRDANVRNAEYQEIRSNILREEGLYNQLLNLLRTVDLNKNLDQETVAVLEPASPAKSTKKPLRLLLIGALCGGGAFGLGIVYLVSYADDRCDSIEDVRSAFVEEVFAQIPEAYPGASSDRRKLPQMNCRVEPLDEAWRGLRSTLLFRRREKADPRILVVTSAVPNEGKSTIALNLAQTLSMGGARVLLVDADLRRGHLHEALGTSQTPGLVDLVIGEGDMESCSVTVDHPNLVFLPRGRASAHAGELFLTATFDRFIEQVKSNFRYIIFDTVPVFAADDATTLAAKADGVLFVVRRGATSAGAVREALDVLYQRRAVVLGLIFNRVKAAARGYRYFKYPEYHEGQAA